MAGDVHVVEERAAPTSLGLRSQSDGRPRADAAAFEEKSFAEYHLYTLGRTTTLANAQTKQIELMNVERIPVTKRYLVRTPTALLNAQPGPGGQQVAVVLEFKNSKETREGLGIPLPKGPFRVYQIDKDKQPEFVGQDEIDHTPKDEPVRVRIGYAFDLAAERVQTANRTKAGERWMEQDWKITLRNHKDQPVTIVVEEPLVGSVNWEILRRARSIGRRTSAPSSSTPDCRRTARRP